MISETNYPTADDALVAGLRTWLIDRVAYYVERESGDIDADAPVASYGLDSVYAFALCGDIEDEFNLRIEPDAGVGFRYGRRARGQAGRRPGS